MKSIYWQYLVIIASVMCSEAVAFETVEFGLVVPFNYKLPDFSKVPEHELPNFEFWNQHERFTYAISVDGGNYIKLRPGARYFARVDTTKPVEFSYYRHTEVGPTIIIFFYEFPSGVDLFIGTSKYSYFEPQYLGWPWAWHYYTTSGLCADSTITKQQLEDSFVRFEERWTESWELVEE